ncbi:hypothetical protein BT96DRAFT_913318 [Gymnopus androsaceus JB14]|uniref:Uncharacterized protein n=1 Tax=Gymnopus androsaceus JB14 TaxID=1447944 RepID=A0A6A4IHE5_9AGAR|nr:hypothetical protein BT96DRAFT_913318 [Gymnopus androsaceus JB14]
MLNVLSEPSTSSSREPKRRRKRASRFSAAPSTGLLSLLATVANTSAVGASPVSLSFLCPGVDEEEIACFNDDIQQSAAVKPKSKRRLPDRYELGTDGLWRKASWNLYGSSMCADCQDDLASATASPTAEIDDISSTSATASGIMDSLPPGWSPLPHENSTGEVLAISLALALSICFFMACCILWRKTSKPLKDAEAHAEKQVASCDDLQARLEKEAKSKQKLLARATARWKTNARYTFLKRRGKRKTVQPIDNDTDSIYPTVVDSTPASPPNSPRSSFSSLPPTQISVHEVTVSTTEEPVSIHISSPASSAPHSPPAYLHHLRSDALLHPTKSESTLPSPASYVQSRGASPSPASDMLILDQSIGPHHMAHVATDDKALLEQLNMLVSSPDAAGLSTRHDTVLAPYWQDEELDDFVNLDPDSSSTANAADPNSGVYSYSVFPPPPDHSHSSNEKGKGVESYSHDYPYSSQPSYVSSYEYNRDIMDIEPEAGPSAPPFEPAENFDAGPSAPPIDLLHSPSEHTSAPPLLLPSDPESTLNEAANPRDLVSASTDCALTSEPMDNGLPSFDSARDPDTRTSVSSRDLLPQRS